MSTPPFPPGERAYRLRGVVDGREKSFALPVGEHEVGSSHDADISLDVTGVSRRHARLRVELDRLWVEDLGSTNGTRVDGVRIERSQLAEGSEVAFGPVRFRVEPAPGDDAVLAIDLGPVPSPATDDGWPRPTTCALEERATSGEPPSHLSFPAGYRVGRSPPMTALYVKMRPLLRGTLPVLIHGETGVGKELVARILHTSSDRRSGPFVAINCAAIPGELLEAELFGVARGAATGVEARPGKFLEAEGGTIFLDEIAEMAPALQPKLLRALQEHEIHPVGGPSRTIDVRVLSATNVELERCMDQGRLRRDLYYRLAGFVLEVPSLRQAAEDIPGLVEHFLSTFVAETGTRVRGLSLGALRALTTHSWPGNIRELEQEVRRLVYLSAAGEVIDSSRLSERFAPRGPGSGDELERLLRGLDVLELAPLVERVEEGLIREALERAGGVKVEACRLLGLSRNGLDKKLKRLGIDSRPFADTPPAAS